jgi:hypothetical protein
MTVDLSGRKYVSEQAKRAEPSCFGKHWVPGYVLLGDACPYCEWTKEPASPTALKKAHVNKWTERRERAREDLRKAEEALAYWADT